MNPHRRTLVAALALGPALAPLGALAQGRPQFSELKPPQPTETAGKIEVVEFFWYGCPHCFAVEPYLEAWLKSKPKGVAFRRIPAAMPNSEFYTDAQAYFTAQILGIGDKIHEPFFNAIHLEGNGALRDDVGALRDFFGKFGVAPKDFDGTWNSFAVQTRMAQAQQEAKRYNVDGVPTIIVNGKWMTGAGYQMAYSDIMKCVQFLVDRELAAQKPAARAKKKH